MVDIEELKILPDEGKSKIMDEPEASIEKGEEQPELMQEMECRY